LRGRLHSPMWSTIFSESGSVLYFISVGNQRPLCRPRFPTEYPFPLRIKKRGGRHKGGRASGQLSIINEHCIKNGSSSQATDDRGILLDVARCSFFCVACVAVHSVDAGSRRRANSGSIPMWMHTRRGLRFIFNRARGICTLNVAWGPHAGGKRLARTRFWRLRA